MSRNQRANDVAIIARTRNNYGFEKEGLSAILLSPLLLRRSGRTTLVKTIVCSSAFQSQTESAK